MEQILSSFLGDKEKVIPLREAAVSDRVQVLAWCSLSYVGVVLQAASSVMDRLALCTLLLRSGPHHCPHTARLSHELVDLKSMLPETLCCPTGCPPLGDGGVDSTCLASACHQAPEALPEVRHTFP